MLHEPFNEATTTHSIDLNAPCYSEHTTAEVGDNSGVSADDIERLGVFLLNRCLEHAGKENSIMMRHRGDIPALFTALAEMYGDPDNCLGVKIDPYCFFCLDRHKMDKGTDPGTWWASLDSLAPIPPEDDVSEAEYWKWMRTSRAQCDECGVLQVAVHANMTAGEKQAVFEYRAMHGNVQFQMCSKPTYVSPYTVNGAQFVTGCGRTLCTHCIEKKLFEREKSRFNSQSPEWQTSLIGCCMSPKVCCSVLACYYCQSSRAGIWETNFNTFKQSAVEQFALEMKEQRTCVNYLLDCLMCAFYMPAIDCCCCALGRIRQHEREVRTRFGVEPHSSIQMFCCRHCVYIRLFREAEARGYPQPNCCTKFADVAAEYPPTPAPPVAPTAPSLL